MSLAITEIPSNVNLLPQSTSTKLIVQKKKVSRRRFKLPAKTRARMRTAARRIKIPVLSVGANIVPVVQGADWFMNIAIKPGIAPRSKALTGFNAIMSPYTGVQMFPTGVTGIGVRLAPAELAKGLLPNAIVWGIRKLGIFKSTNARLSKMRIPISLS